MKRASEEPTHLYAAKKARVVDVYGRLIESMDIQEDGIWLIKKTARPKPLTAVRGKVNRPKAHPQPIRCSSWVLKRNRPFEKESHYSLKKTKHTDEKKKCLNTMDIYTDLSLRLSRLSIL